MEFGSEQEVGRYGFQELPPRIRAAVGDECKYIGKPIPLLTLHGQLWVAAATDTACMGSGGTYMSLVLDVKGKEATVVLGTGAVSGIDLDPATTHHDLPDVFVESSSNCCGSGSNGYRYDGKEYQEATEKLEADLASQISDEVKDPGVPGVDTRPGCSLKEGRFWEDSDNPGLKIIASLCDDEDQTRVWLIRRGVADKRASEILAREDLSHQDVIVTWEKQAKTLDVSFPDAKPAPVTWHFDKNKFTRVPPSAPPASNSTSVPGGQGEAAGSK
jgi:hypothetical protein